MRPFAATLLVVVVAAGAAWPAAMLVAPPSASVDHAEPRGAPPDFAGANFKEASVARPSSSPGPAGFFSESRFGGPNAPSAFSFSSGLLGARFEPGHVDFSLVGHADRGAVVRLAFEGAGPALPSGSAPLGFPTHVLRGSDPAAWQSGLRSFAQVRFVQLYPGVDLVYTTSSSTLKYELQLAAGADLSAVHFAFEGALSVEVLRDGATLIHSAAGELRDEPPVSYDADGASVACRPVKRALFTLGFDCPTWGGHNGLTIDPLLYASYLGGNGEESVYAAAPGPAGSIFLAGYTSSSDFPVTPGAYDAAFDASYQGACFVMKFSADFGALLWATYLETPGSGTACKGLAVDGAGTSYVTGATRVNFPTTNGSFDTSENGGVEAFVTHLNATGDGLLWSTFLGGAAFDGGEDLFLEANGSVLVAGVTSSSDFPTTPGAYDRTVGAADLFLARLSGGGDALLASTVLGGSSNEVLPRAAVDSQGNAYLAGITTSSDFPASATAADRTYAGTDEGYLARVNASLAALDFATFLGGSDRDEVTGVSVGQGERAIVTGWTYSADFPTTNGSFNQTRGGLTDSFALQVNAAGTSFGYSTFLGGSGLEIAGPVVADPAGGALLVGYTESADFPLIPGSDNITRSSGQAYVLRLNAGGSGVSYGSLFGRFSGAIGTGPQDAALDASGRLLVAGDTVCCAFDITPGAFQGTIGGGSNEAWFALVDPTLRPFNFTINATGTGILLSAGGAPRLAPFNISCTYGDLFDVGADTPQGGGLSRLAFVGWSDGGARNHTAQCVEPLHLDATFQVEYRTTIDTSPSGFLIRVDGADVPTPFVTWWLEATWHTMEPVVHQPVAPGEQWEPGCYTDGICAGNLRNGYGGETPGYTQYFIRYVLLIVYSTPSDRIIQYNGGWTRTPVSAWVRANETFTLDPLAFEAGPNERFLFDGWVDGGPAHREPAISTPTNFSARFLREVPMSLGTYPPNLNVSINGSELPTPVVLWWRENVSQHWDTPPVQGNNTTRYTFLSWNWPPLNASSDFSINRSEVAQATFLVEHLVNISTRPLNVTLVVDGANEMSPFLAWWADGSVHTVSVPSAPDESDEHHSFLNWSDNTTGEWTHRIEGPLTLKGNLSVDYRVEVRSSLAGLELIVDDNQVFGLGKYYWALGSRHGVGAVAIQRPTDSRLSFASWSDGGEIGHSFTVEGPIVLVATFNLEYHITVRSDPSGVALTVDGEVMSQPFKIYWWVATSVHVIVAPMNVTRNGTSPFEFKSWSDGGSANHTVRALAPTEYVATFGPPPPRVVPETDSFPTLLVVAALGAAAAVVGIVALASKKRRSAGPPPAQSVGPAGPAGSASSMAVMNAQPPAPSPPPPGSGLVPCPRCGSPVQFGAPYCLHCGLDIVWQ